MKKAKDRPTTISGQPMSLLDCGIVKVGNIIGWLYFVAVLISVFEVVLRYGFNRPTSWAHEITLMLVGIGMVWGGAYCMAEDRHIRVTVIRDAMPVTLRRVVDVFVGFLTLLFCSGLAWAGYIMFQKSVFDPSGALRLQRTGSAFNSPAPAVVKTMLFIVVILMTIQAIQQLITKVQILLSSRENSANQRGGTDKC